MDSSAAPKPVHLSENNGADRGGDSPPELGTPRWSATKQLSTSRQPTAALQGLAPEQPSLTPSVPGGIIPHSDARPWQHADNAILLTYAPALAGEGQQPGPEGASAGNVFKHEQLENEAFDNAQDESELEAEDEVLAVGQEPSALQGLTPRNGPQSQSTTGVEEALLRRLAKDNELLARSAVSGAHKPHAAFQVALGAATHHREHNPDAKIQEGAHEHQVAPHTAAHHREQNYVSTAVSTAGGVTVPNADSTNVATSAVTGESDPRHQATGGSASLDHLAAGSSSHTVVALDDDHQTSYELRGQQRSPSDVQDTMPSSSTTDTQAQAQRPAPPLPAGQVGGRPQQPDAVTTSVVVRFADAALGSGHFLAVPFAVPHPTVPLLLAQDVAVHMQVAEKRPPARPFAPLRAETGTVYIVRLSGDGAAALLEPQDTQDTPDGTLALPANPPARALPFFLRQCQVDNQVHPGGAGGKHKRGGEEWPADDALVTYAESLGQLVLGPRDLHVADGAANFQLRLAAATPGSYVLIAARCHQPPGGELKLPKLLLTGSVESAQRLHLAERLAAATEGLWQAGSGMVMGGNTHVTPRHGTARAPPNAVVWVNT